MRLASRHGPFRPQHRACRIPQNQEGQMYSSSAPATACDNDADLSTDNAHPSRARNDLKIVGLESNSATPPTNQDAAEAEKSEPETNLIAAKILKMHASAEDNAHDDARPSGADHGGVQEGPDIRPFSEMPSLLRREMDGADELDQIETDASDWTPERRSAKRSSRPAGNGPSFRTLVVSTIVVVVAGGAAMALGLRDFVRRDDTSSISAQTQTPAAEPTIESLIADGSEAGALEIPTNSDGSPTANQIASAKEQIRRALNDGLAGKPVAVTGSPDLQNGTTETSDGKIQARLVPAPAPAASATGEPRQIRQGTIRVSNRAAAADATGDAALMEEGDPILPGSDDALADESGSTQATETAALNGSFPHTGKTVSAVNMRQSAESGAEVIAVVPGSAEVRYSQCGEWWCNISYDGKSGYISARFLDQTAQN
ncbi:SH3 domain-containing protein [Rhodobacterales bacterium]|nr:SH3 domain-containing protein [Rhodobacterales bacterium]